MAGYSEDIAPLVDSPPVNTPDTFAFKPTPQRPAHKEVPIALRNSWREFREMRLAKLALRLRQFPGKVKDRLVNTRWERGAPALGLLATSVALGALGGIGGKVAVSDGAIPTAVAFARTDGPAANQNSFSEEKAMQQLSDANEKVNRYYQLMLVSFDGFRGEGSKMVMVNQVDACPFVPGIDTPSSRIALASLGLSPQFIADQLPKSIDGRHVITTSQCSDTTFTPDYIYQQQLTKHS